MITAKDIGFATRELDPTRRSRECRARLDISTLCDVQDFDLATRPNPKEYLAHIEVKLKTELLRRIYGDLLPPLLQLYRSVRRLNPTDPGNEEVQTLTQKALDDVVGLLKGSAVEVSPAHLAMYLLEEIKANKLDQNFDELCAHLEKFALRQEGLRPV